MRFFDYFRMALKNLIRQKARTFLTIIAITVGSLSLILMVSIIVSIRQSLVDQLQSLGAFDLVTVAKDPNSTNSDNLISSNGDPSEGKKIDDGTLTTIRQLPNVAEVTPILSGFSIGTVRLDGQDKKTWANIVGFDPNNDVFNTSIAYGRKLTSADMDKIVIGNTFAQDMGYGSHPKDLLGKNVILMYKGGGNNAPDWGNPPEKPPLDASEDWYKSQNNKSLDIPAEIVGISDNGALDSGQSYINIAWARKLMTRVSWQGQDQKDQKTQNSSQTMVLHKEDDFTQQGYNSLIIKVNDTNNVNSVAEAVKKLGYGANTAQAMLDQINKILLLVGIVLAVIGGISLFVAAIGIINTMIMATYERIREIGVMRACGATRATIRHLFTFEAALLGFWGGVFGMIISFILARVAKLLVVKFGASLGSLPIDRIGSFPVWLILAVLAMTTLLGILAGLVPAIRAAHMDPVDALRYE